ncbi:MAG: oligosaccharide flippase family protein [Colwellia sp.]|nr:oligosaccharide flippase family protein [Colwellia sp.]
MLIRNSAVYFSASVLSKSVPFLLLPLMTKYLEPSEYGLLSIYLIFISFYSAFIGMNMHVNISRLFFNQPRGELAVFIGNILIILSVTATFYWGVTLVATAFVDSFFSISLSWLLLIPAISFMVMINEINTTILRNEERAYMFGVFEISNIVLKMSLTILFLLVFGFSWYSQVFGIVVSSLIFSIIGFSYIKNRHYMKLKFDLYKIKSILNISIPLIPHAIGGVVITMSDRLFIEKMLSLEAVGIYTIGYMFGMVVMLFTDAFVRAWSPWFYRNISSASYEDKQGIVNKTYIYILTLFMIAILYSFIAARILPYIVSYEYLPASKYIMWVSLGYVAFGIYQIFFPYLVHSKKTQYIAISTTIAAITNLFGNYFLIGLFGAVGAAYSTIIAYVVSMLIIMICSAHFVKMPWFSFHCRLK